MDGRSFYWRYPARLHHDLQAVLTEVGDTVKKLIGNDTEIKGRFHLRIELGIQSLPAAEKIYDADTPGQFAPVLCESCG